MNENILFLVMTGSTMEERRFNIDNTWGKDIDLIYYSDHEEQNVIKVTFGSDYRFVELKQINIINKFPENLIQKYNWFFFADDDTFVNTKLLRNNLKNFEPEFVHGKEGIYKMVDSNLNYLSGGAGFLMHKNILLKLKSKLTYLGTGFGDVTMGIHYKKNNIQIKHDPRFCSQTPQVENIEDVENYFTFHYIKKFEDMIEIYNKCNN